MQAKYNNSSIKIKKIHTINDKEEVCVFLSYYKIKRKNKINLLERKIDELNQNLIKSNLIEISELLQNRRKMLFRQFTSGIAKGVGIGIGVTIITAVLIIVLQKIVSLNIPVIGEYIADIVEIVEKR